MIVYLNISYLEGGKTRLRLKLNRKEATSTRLTQVKEKVWYFVAWVAFRFCLHSDMIAKWYYFCFDLSWSHSGLFWCWYSVKCLWSKEKHKTQLQVSGQLAPAELIGPGQPDVSGAAFSPFSLWARWDFSDQVFLENVDCCCTRSSHLCVLLQDDMSNTPMWQLLYSSIGNSGQNTPASCNMSNFQIQNGH